MVDTDDGEAVKAQIRAAFAAVEHPGDARLTAHPDEAEAKDLAAELAGTTDWRGLDAERLDQAPAGLGTALGLLADEAFRFYLPAYLTADVDGRLQQHDPVFHLTQGLDDASKRGHADRGAFERATRRLSCFDRAQCAAIAAYLAFARDRAEDEAERDEIDQALRNYWTRRATAPR